MAAVFSVQFSVFSKTKIQRVRLLRRGCPESRIAQQPSGPSAGEQRRAWRVSDEPQQTAVKRKTFESPRRVPSVDASERMPAAFRAVAQGRDNGLFDDLRNGFPVFTSQLARLGRLSLHHELRVRLAEPSNRDRWVTGAVSNQRLRQPQSRCSKRTSRYDRHRTIAQS